MLDQLYHYAGSCFLFHDVAELISHHSLKINIMELAGLLKGSDEIWILYNHRS